jgi:hypothetical protein
MSANTAEPKPALSAYTPDEVQSIVAVRCQELSALLGWNITPPAVRFADPSARADARDADIRVRSEKIRGAARDEGWLSTLSSWVSRTFGPSVLGYFATSQNTLFLNGELLPQQAGYVLMHELTHAAQWQNFPSMFAAIDAARVAAEDAADRSGEGGGDAAVLRDRYVSLVTFVEGHATGIGRRACEERILRDSATVAPADAKAFVAAMMGLDTADEMTALVYVRGDKTVADLDSSRIEALFRDPDGVVKLFTQLAS